MDSSLKDFREALQRALQTGDSSAVATKETEERLKASPGWVSALRVSASRK